MRRRSARRRTLVSMAVTAAVVAMSVVAVPTEVSGPEPAAAQDEDSAAGKLATSLFKSLAEGAAGEVGGNLAGWALGALGLGDASGGGADLQPIEDELGEIDTQLNEIRAALDSIEKEIAGQGCDNALARVDQPVSAIKTAYGRYRAFAQDAAESNPPTTDAMGQWANDVLTGDNDIGVALDNALNTIGEVMVDAGGTGIVEACVDAEVVPPPAENTFGDASYYGYGDSQTSDLLQVNDFVSYFYNYQALGVMMFNEALHFQAQQAAGETGLTPQQVGQLCINQNNYSSDVSTACKRATNAVNDLYEDLVTQHQLAGLPYTDSGVITLNGTSLSSSHLLVRSLEEFTQFGSGGLDCPTPLTSDDPCGVTVAAGSAIDDNMHVDFGEWGVWGVASANVLTRMIKGRGSMTPAAWLRQHGFSDTADKLLLTRDTASISLYYRDDLFKSDEMRCFLYTSSTRGVYCNGTQAWDNSDIIDSNEPDPPGKLLQAVEVTQKNSFNYFSYEANSSVPSGVNGFFNAKSGLGGSDDSFSWKTKPGWLVENTGQRAAQYRWPAIALSAITCGASSGSANPGGVGSRCGDAFEATFEALVTRPASCGGTTFGVCTTDTYHILESDGDVHTFGDDAPSGGASAAAVGGVKDDLLEGESAVAIAGRRGSVTYWVLTDRGRILGRGGTTAMPGITPQGSVVAQVDMSQLTEPGEALAALAATPDRRGLWVFTTSGRILSFGDAQPSSEIENADDVLALDLEGPVVDVAALTEGAGAYMVGDEGGVFATGSARFVNSVRGVLADLYGPPGLPAQPIVGVISDPDLSGYWLVGADGGVFSFDADFRGSLPDLVAFEDLVAPIENAAPFGDGYVLVAQDGGLFNFSSKPFAGSAFGLVDTPVVDVATGT